MKKPTVIDAEFTVVGEVKPRRYNGLGLPPRWAEWGWPARAFFVIGWCGMMYGLWVMKHWIDGLHLMRLIGVH
jgi:hypothetical protein